MGSSHVHGGALHSAFFARRHVDASDGCSYGVRIDATPRGLDVVGRFRVKRSTHRNGKHTMRLPGVAFFQIPYLQTIFAR